MTEARGQLLDGTITARALRNEVAREVAERVQSGHNPPHLAAVLIGDDPASHTYVGMKQKACAQAGIVSSIHTLPSSCTQSNAENLVKSLNLDPSISGILVQHPLPSHLHETSVLDLVSPEKDVDGICRASLGGLINGEPAFPSCTPAGIIELLDRYSLPIEGKHAVVIGRSIILGKPVAVMLLNRNATVTICHSRTPNITQHLLNADIVVAAVGKAEMIKGNMLKPGAVVIDAGYNKVAGRKGDVGDVEFETAVKVASYITPVPGGVGPMTIAILLRNTLRASQGRYS